MHGFVRVLKVSGYSCADGKDNRGGTRRKNVRVQTARFELSVYNRPRGLGETAKHCERGGGGQRGKLQLAI